MSYRTLEVWERARLAAIDIHQMSLTSLPKFEFYENGSQIRRSAHSIRSNIVEGYGRRRYKLEFMKHLTYAMASCDETTDHLEALMDTKSLSDQHTYNRLHDDLSVLGKKLNHFLQSVEKNHLSVR